MLSKNRVAKRKKKRHLVVSLFSLIAVSSLLYLAKLQILSSQIYILLTAIVIGSVILFNIIDRFRFFGQNIRVCERVLAFLLSIALIFSMSLIWKFHSSLELMVSLSKFSLNRVDVIVKQESPYKKISDLENKKLGVSNANEIKDMQEYAKAKIASKIAFTPVNHFEVLTLFSMLEKGEIDALLIDELSLPLIKEVTNSYQKEYRSIHHVDRKIVTMENEKEINVAKKPFNVYISGIDTYGKINTVSRSDVNMIISVNPITQEILLVNTPRDYYVKSACLKNKEDKLTHCGSYGIQCSIETLENLYEIDINYYVRVNFSSVEKIVDALGGVEVEVEKNFCFEGNCLKKGKQFLNGKQALLFSRERHSLDNGDEDRGHNQQKVIQALIYKASSKSMIRRVDKLLNAIEGSFETNMSVDSMLSLIKLQLTKSPNWNITMSAVTGEGINETTASTPNEKLYVMIPDLKSVEQVKAQFNKLHSTLRTNQEK